MDQTTIFAPVFAMFFLTMIVWVYMYAKRIPYIQTNNFTRDEMEPIEFARNSPPDVANPSDNLKNLFEVPLLFYALAGYLFITNQVDTIYLVTAWVFVVFRIVHSAVHCTVNIILLRFSLYLIATLSLWFAIARAATQYFF